MKNSEKIQAVLFDMDGVIVDSMPAHSECWQCILAEHGLSIDVHEFYIREGMSGRESVRDIFVSHGHPEPADDELDRLILKKHALFEDRIIPVYPWVTDILDLLKSRGVRIGLVTGSIRRTISHILDEKFLSAFDAVITADIVQNGKPHPEPYLKGLKKLRCGVDSAVAVENAPMGIRSAKGAGITCWALATTLESAYLQEADEIFGGHLELFEAFKRHL